MSKQTQAIADTSTSTGTTKIKPCTCHHEWQDKTYGRGNRVHNRARGLFSGKGGWRCTVCEKTSEG